MSSRRLGLSLVVLGNYLYAIGGSDGQIPLNTVERCMRTFEIIHRESKLFNIKNL